MNRIADAFRRKAFVAFITCGDPDLETTEKLAVALAENGADLIELGIPFSDPTAEGPTIQAANLRALSGGVTTEKILDAAASIRKKVSIPLAFMTYANVVFSYGTERFISRMAQIGVDGLILPDVPFEEKEEFDTVCRAHGVDLISLIAPTSHERVARIAREASGFVYCVSSLGVTGTRDQIDTATLPQTIAAVRAATKTPCAVGFGVSTPQQARAIAAVADGVIIGSAIVRLVARDGAQSPAAVAEYARGIRAALDEAT